MFVKRRGQKTHYFVCKNKFLSGFWKQFIWRCCFMNKQLAFFVAGIIVVCMLCVTVATLSKGNSVTTEKTKIKTQALVIKDLGFCQCGVL